MAKVITAPNEITDGDEGLHVFLAGGITGCADWQREIINNLEDVRGLVLHNPRRDDFPIHDPTAARRQIEWEHLHLRLCDAIAFWFSPETLNPIVLYELGAWSMTRKKPLYVGVHPEYKRRQDVEIQTELARPDVRIVYSLDELTEQIRASAGRGDTNAA